MAAGGQNRLPPGFFRNLPYGKFRRKQPLFVFPAPPPCKNPHRFIFKVISSPSLTLPAPLSITSQIPAELSARNNPSSLPPVLRRAKNRAGSTFVSLSTRQSRARRKSPILLNLLSVIWPLSRCKTSSRDSLLNVGRLLRNQFRRQI